LLPLKTKAMISILITLVIIGVVLYLINLIPMDGTIKKVIWVLAILFIILWLLSQLGIIGSIHIK
jgi:ABC-type siderophore export system fused ATPase/permease subunit